ncbi:MAG: helix-turn-helix transcriptional regulator [Flavobacteriales bacterium]|nr:helix-turn-helix transcriptional regulator [Flavobacteriales bacterium]
MAPRTLTRGKRMELVRVALGWTQEYTGDRVGLSQSTISYIEHDEVEPRFSEMVKLCEVLGIPLETMIGDNDPGRITITFDTPPPPPPPRQERSE